MDYVNESRRRGRPKSTRDYEKGVREPRRAAIWLRVSTGKQDLRSQRLAVERYAQVRGWKIVERFEELGVSGAAAGRQVVSQVLDGVRRGRWDAVLCFRMDRAFRSAGRAAVFMDELRANGGHFVGVEDGIDTSTVLGEAMAKVASVFAELERHGIRARIHAGLEAARAAGQTLGRPREAVLGLDVDRLLARRTQGASWGELGIAFETSPATIRRRWLEAAKQRKRRHGRPRQPAPRLAVPGERGRAGVRNGDG